MLLALALIFLPIIFDGQGSYQSPLSSRIPAPPLISILPEPVAARPVIIADTEASEVSEVPRLVLSARDSDLILVLHDAGSQH